MPNHTTEPPGVDFATWLRLIETSGEIVFSTNYRAYWDSFHEEDHASALPPPTVDAEVVQLQDGCTIVNGVIVKKRNV